MKKIFMTLSLLGLLCVFPSSAQTFRLGVMGGMNVSSTTESESKAGLRVGLKGEYCFADASEGLFLGAGVLLSGHPFKGNTFYYQEQGVSKRWDATPYYLNIPLHVGYKLPCGKGLSLFASAGPYVGFGLFGKEKCITEGSGKATEEEVSKNVFSDKVLNRFDYGLGFRLGAEFAGHVQLSAGWDWGLKNVDSRHDKNRNNNFNVSVAYMF